MNPSHPRLSDAAWATLRSAWDTRPAVLHDPFEGELPRTSDFFRAATAAADNYRRVGNGARFFLELSKDEATHETFSALVYSPQEYLPDSSDASLDAYVERAARAARPGRFCLLVNDLQRHDWPLWQRMRPFLVDLYSRVGVPLGGASINGLTGNYRNTPFGIHKDDQHVFTIVLEGKKRMLLWPLSTFAEQATRRGIERASLKEKVVSLPMTHAELQAAAESAIVIEAHAGDLMYWPSSYWHVAVGDGERATTISWDLRAAATALRGVATPAIDDVAPQVPVRVRSIAKGGDIPLPAPFERSLRPRITRDAVARGRQAAAGPWLRFHTGCAALLVPAPREPLTLTDDDTIRRADDARIAWCRVSPGACVFSANGHSLDLTADRGTLDVVCDVFRALNRGRAIRVRALTAKLVGRRAIARETLRAILGVLGAWRAVDRA